MLGRRGAEGWCRGAWGRPSWDLLAKLVVAESLFGSEVSLKTSPTGRMCHLTVSSLGGSAFRQGAGVSEMRAPTHNALYRPVAVPTAVTTLLASETLGDGISW